MLGTEPLWRPFSRRARGARAAARDGRSASACAVDPDARVGELSVGERQRVEILKALYRGARILILDEPTAVLTPQESEALFATLAQMVAQGLSIIFISHKLDEVLRVSRPHRGAARRQAGRRGARRAAPTQAQLAQRMVGQAVDGAGARGRAAAGDVGLRAATTCSTAGGGRDRLRRRVARRCAPARSSPIAGVSGNGQQALAELLCGMRRADARQRCSSTGAPLAADAARGWSQRGVARIPEDRHAVGVVGDLPVWENAVLRAAAHAARSRARAVRAARGGARACARASSQAFDVRGGGARRAGALALRRQHAEADPRPRAARARWRDERDAAADRRPPADLGPRHRRRRLRARSSCSTRARRGAAVLLISDDLDEIFALADRIAVMHARPARARRGRRRAGRARRSAWRWPARRARRRMRLERARRSLARAAASPRRSAAVAFTLRRQRAAGRLGRRAGRPHLRAAARRRLRLALRAGARR